ncbi:hypothetical protein V1509DRAFT_607629 [Lipomyces kononenkoae]
MSILDLPVELLQVIACYVPTQDLLSFALACSNFNKSLNCPSQWDSRIRHDYCNEGIFYARMILNHYNQAHQWNITLRQICIALHAAWSTSCREGTWQVGFKQSPRRCREHSIPDYWVQISRRMRVPPGKYAVRWNLETTEECLGQIRFRVTTDDDSEEQSFKEETAIHAHQEDKKDDVQLIEHATATSNDAARRAAKTESPVLCETVLPRALVTRIYEHTTIDHQGTEVKMGYINVPKTDVRRHEWRDITISLDMQGGWNANMKLNSITLCPIKQDTPIDASSTPKIEYSSPQLAIGLAERCQKAFDCFGCADVTYDTIVNSLKIMVGN